MIKEIYKYADIKEKIIKAVDTLADPIKNTISPKGRNVIYEDENGVYNSSNDGATLAKLTEVEDPIENAIIGIIKGASLKTNSEVGDGTSTSILLSSILIKEGFKIIENGTNPMILKKKLELFRDIIIKEIKKQAIKVTNDDELLEIATVSANSDKEIAKDVVKAVKSAGLDGMIFLENNNVNKVEVIEDQGFFINSGLFLPELKNNKNTFSATYLNAPILVTDKRIYYKEEAETILKTVLMSGYKSVIIVAKDFIGQSVNYFVANHLGGNCNVLMVKVSESEVLEDLAVYLGTKVVTEKAGRIVDNLKIDDFVLCKKVFADVAKTIIQSNHVPNPQLALRIAAIRKELKKDKDNEELKTRLASITSGMVTIKIGASTPVEARERAFRFEDAINATRVAMRDGYLVGGGIALYNAFKAIKFPLELYDEGKLIKRFCEANIRQIALNCGEYPDNIIKDIDNSPKNHGYNALTGKIEDLLKVGVVDPYKVTEMVVNNSISVANEILSSEFLIINKIEKNGESKK